ncbi:hypothetical protein BG844_18600 [Couchioplanes caeruleus subsp. caeruleus]|uniref:Para-aminobenzoate N-oxygenase AurF n=1 Tax=Couchioplanes caeruleus subsp. caeruleus TaxID=56427 RepID=A0A1K0G6C8_9ACTN|nr:hypothetical protein BG844_18600 [Couchioplanes caeruleus subsp. caeruleus]
MVTGDGPAHLYFPPELVPAVSHPLVTSRGPGAVRQLLLSRLYQYLDFTIQLEAAAVIPVTLDISLNRSGLALPRDMQRDAFKITTDEAWHAQFSDDLMTQIAHDTGIPVRLPHRPYFLDRLARIRAAAASEVRGCTDLAFAVVSETLISALLADLPKDRRLPPSVRDLVADHAEDEGRHHAYFRSVLQAFWPSLDVRQQRTLGPMFPELMEVFLEPDPLGLAYALSDIGLDTPQVEQVLAESYPEGVVRAQIADAAATTVRYLWDVGALADPATREAFHAAGLIVEAG